MSMHHLPRQDLALYVLGTLEPAATARLEEHVAACPSCAAALADEAQLEVKLQVLVPAALRELPARPSGARPAPLLTELPAARRRWPAVAMLAATLAVVVGLARVTQPPPVGRGGESLSALSTAESFSEWLPETGPLQCGQPGSGLLCEPQSPESPAISREASFSAAASWLPIESSEGFTPITAACYAPR